MANFKFLKLLVVKLKYVCVWHLKFFFPLYLLTCIVAEVLIIYKFLIYMTKNKFHKLQKCKYLDCNVNVYQ